MWSCSGRRESLASWWPRYPAQHAPKGVRVGLAGRSQDRLEQVRAGLGAAAAKWPLIVADSADPASLGTLAGSARVVVTTVGPYRPRGLPLVAACAEAGTDYIDLSGEVLFQRDSIDRYHAVAERAGARIVHGCGFDSIPSDLGVHLLRETVRADGGDTGGDSVSGEGEEGGDLEDTTLVVTRLRGGFSGGTLSSIIEQLDEVRADPQLRRAAADPYALSPDRAAEPDLGRQRDLARVQRDAGLDIWTGPFLMASINTRVVRRSNALLGWAYGRKFRYREVSGYGTGRAGAVRAAAATTAMGALAAGLTYPRTRRLLVGRVLPGPGQGPSGADPAERAVPDRDPHPDLGRAALPGPGRGPGRPRLPGHLGHDGRVGAGPGAGPGPAAGPGRGADPGHGPGHRAHRPAPHGRDDVRGRAARRAGVTPANAGVGVAGVLDGLGGTSWIKG